MFKLVLEKAEQTDQNACIAQSCPTLCDPMDCSTPGPLSITNCQSLHKLMSIESVMPFNHLILCCPLLLLPSIFPSIRVFSNESALCIRWPKYWRFSISPSNEYSGLISFRIDWFDLLAVQETLKSLLQHHSAKASILWCSAFFMVQLSHSRAWSLPNIWLPGTALVDVGCCQPRGHKILHVGARRGGGHSKVDWGQHDDRTT